MVASSLFLSMILLGAPAPRQVRPAGMLSDAASVRSHLVVPTGLAVPLGRRDALPAPTDLFKSGPGGTGEAVFSFRAYRSDPAGGSF